MWRAFYVMIFSCFYGYDLPRIFRFAYRVLSNTRCFTTQLPMSITYKDLCSKEHCSDSIVLPSDIDFLWHMNNAKYHRELDFARFDFLCKTGLGSYVLITQTHVSYIYLTDCS